MAKGPNVQYDESDSESDCEDEEPSMEELIELSKEAYSLMNKKMEWFKDLRKRYKALEQTFEEHLATHEALIDTHEKLKEAHSSLHAQKKELIEIASVGVTCDILDESFYAPIVVAPTNPSCSTNTSPMSDGFTCDASLMVENETIKKEVNELTHALCKAYGGEARLLKCLGSQRFSLNKEGLGYTPKKGKATFATHKTQFVRGNGRFCNKC